MAGHQRITTVMGFCDKNMSSDVWGEKEEGLCGASKKNVCYQAPSLRERTEEGPCSENSVFPPAVAAVNTLPRTWNYFHTPVFEVPPLDAWLAYLPLPFFLYVTSHGCPGPRSAC